MVNGNLIMENDVGMDGDTGIFVENRIGRGDGGPISIRVNGGSLTMGKGTIISSENEVKNGSGGDIAIGVFDGALTMADKATISSSKLTSNSGKTGAGGITIEVDPGVNSDAVDISLGLGSIVAANALSGRAGNISMEAGGLINIDGLVASGPSTTALPTKLTGKVLDGGDTRQRGGAITIISNSQDDAGVVITHGINVSTEGIIVSQGQDPASDVIFIEACGIQIHGLVASVAKKSNGLNPHQNPDQQVAVILRSGKTVDVWGQDLGLAGSNQGRVRADYNMGEAHFPQKVDIHARGDVNVMGPSVLDGIFAVTSNGGGSSNTIGGTIEVISLGGPPPDQVGQSGKITTHGNAFSANGNSRGGVVSLTARQDVDLRSATVEAQGGDNDISVRSFQNNILADDSTLLDVAPGSMVELMSASTIDFPFGGVAPATVLVINSGIPFNPADLVALDALRNLPVCRAPEKLEFCPICSGEEFVLDFDLTFDLTKAPNAGGVIADTSDVDYSGAKLAAVVAAVTFDTSSNSPDQWFAKIDVGSDRLVIADNTTITTDRIRVGGARHAPGMVIRTSCELLVEKDLDGDGEAGTVLVNPRNGGGGDIVIGVDGRIEINGIVRNVVSGTQGTPGQIILVNRCGDITTGPMSVVETIGVDDAGADIKISSGDDISADSVGGDIRIEGLVQANYKKQKGGKTADIYIFAFNGAITVVAPDTGSVRKPIRGVHNYSKKDPIAGDIVMQANGNVRVFGPTDSRSDSRGAVSGNRKATNGKGGEGVIDVRSVNGAIFAQDHAFDFSNKFGQDQAIELRASQNIDLVASVGPVAVVDNIGARQGGANRLRSFGGQINIGASAQVLAGFNGTNHLLAAGAINNLGLTDPAAITPPVDDPILNSLVPLFESRHALCEFVPSELPGVDPIFPPDP